MNSFRSEKGQALVVTALFIVALLGMATFVIDIGSWFRAQRDTQSIADAAALAGAQELPDSTVLARARAEEYIAKNGPEGAEDNAQINFGSSGWGPNEIHVEIRRDAPGVFAKVFSIDSVNVGAKAAARASGPGAIRWVAPIVVHHEHEKLMCRPDPCFDEDTTIPLDHLHGRGSGEAAGSFGLISLNDNDLDADTLAEWLFKGYSDYMWKDKNYRAAPSANFNNGQFQEALRDRMGTELVFPIYDRIVGSGSTARYHVIGFATFIVEEVIGGGAAARLRGYFKKVTWDSLAAAGPPTPDFGIRTIELIE